MNTKTWDLHPFKVMTNQGPLAGPSHVHACALHLKCITDHLCFMKSAFENKSFDKKVRLLKALKDAAIFKNNS